MTKKMIKNKKILVTGGAGFIGSYLVDELVDDNKIIIYDNFHRNALKYTKFKNHKNLKIVHGDIMDQKLLSETVDDCDIILHLAAIAGVENVINSPLKTLEINLMGTYNLLQAINGRSKKIDRFVFFSTSEVYGPFVYQASEEGMTTQGVVSESRWSYATSKIAAEHWVYAYFRRFRLPIVIIRPFNVYGERQVGESAVSKFVAAAVEKKPLEIYGAGSQIRAWCYVDDMTQAINLVLTQPQAIGQVYNVGNPEGTSSILELAKKIKKLTNSSSEIVFKKRNYPDVELRIPSIQKAETELGYKPVVDLDEGLEKTIRWYRGENSKP